VYEVSKRFFDAYTAAEIIKYFTANATGVRVTSPTKEELEQELILTKKGTYVEDDNGGRWEPYEGQQQDIKNIEEKIKNALPEVFNPITADQITLPVMNTYLMPDGTRKYIGMTDKYISLTTENRGILQLESWIIGGNAIPGEPVGTTLKNVKASEEEACNKVSVLLSSLGIENMGIAEAEKARIISEFTGKTITEGWCITCALNDGNCIPINFNSLQLNGMLYFGSEDFVQRWFPETMTIFIDETGIRSLYWTHMLEVTKEMNTNVPLLEFNDIKDRIKKYIEFGYSYRVQKGQVHGQNKIAINKIVLTNVLVPIKDDLDHQMLQPAWLVYYSEPEEKNMTYVFAVNAIDGSSIDLSMRTQMPQPG